MGIRLLLTFLCRLSQHPLVALETELRADGAGEPERLPGETGTRLSGAWTAVVFGLITLVVILVFILQNQNSVELSFLVFSGRLPLAVALLFAMILGALIVVAFGAARILQLRMVAGRARRESAKKVS